MSFLFFLSEPDSHVSGQRDSGADRPLWHTDCQGRRRVVMLGSKQQFIKHRTVSTIKGLHLDMLTSCLCWCICCRNEEQLCYFVLHYRGDQLVSWPDHGAETKLGNSVSYSSSPDGMLHRVKKSWLPTVSNENSMNQWCNIFYPDFARGIRAVCSRQVAFWLIVWYEFSLPAA